VFVYILILRSTYLDFQGPKFGLFWHFLVTLTHNLRNSDKTVDKTMLDSGGPLTLDKTCFGTDLLYKRAAIVVFSPRNRHVTKENFWSRNLIFCFVMVTTLLSPNETRPPNSSPRELCSLPTYYTGLQKLNKERHLWTLQNST